MDMNEFLNKVKERGYEAQHRTIDGFRDELIISEDDYYHVYINPTAVFDVPFEEIMNHVKHEIQKLKDKTKGKIAYIN